MDNICVNGKTKIYHANLLKLYHERADNAADITLQLDVAGRAVIDPELDDDEECVLANENLLKLRPRADGETYEDVNISKDLSARQREEIQELLQEGGNPIISSLESRVLSTWRSIRLRPPQMSQSESSSAKCHILCKL